MSPLGFKARVDPSLACFVACMQWIPEIHLWCDTCWLYRGQHGSQAFSSTYLQVCLQALVEVSGSKPWPSVLHAWRCRPLGHSGSSSIQTDLNLRKRQGRWYPRISFSAGTAAPYTAASITLSFSEFCGAAECERPPAHHQKANSMQNLLRMCNFEMHWV